MRARRSAARSRHQPSTKGSSTRARPPTASSAAARPRSEATRSPCEASTPKTPSSTSARPSAMRGPERRTAVAVVARALAPTSASSAARRLSSDCRHSTADADGDEDERDRPTTRRRRRPRAEQQQRRRRPRAPRARARRRGRGPRARRRRPVAVAPSDRRSSGQPGPVGGVEHEAEAADEREHQEDHADARRRPVQVVGDAAAHPAQHAPARGPVDARRDDWLGGPRLHDPRPALAAHRGRTPGCASGSVQGRVRADPRCAATPAAGGR